MSGTSSAGASSPVGQGWPADEAVRPWALDSLLVFVGAYRPRVDGSFLYVGERPGERWHAHGTTARWMWILRGGRVCRVLLRKQRWKDREAGGTVHNRPPDDVEGLRVCTLLLTLKLWSWIGRPEGLRRRREVFDGLPRVGSSRTLQRWLRWACPLALRTQQAIRAEILERSEPRPLESLFPGGLSPPWPEKKRWSDPAGVRMLRGALLLLLGGAGRLQVPAARLLAGARGRWTGQQGRFVI
jgi:hypothetical protein